MPTLPITTYDAGAKQLIPFFMTINVLAIVINVLIVVLTFTHQSIRRPATFINFCAMFVLFSISYALLLLAGFPNDPNPPFALCVVQTAAVYGTVLMLGLAYFTLQLTFWAILRESSYRSTLGVLTPTGKILTVILPYLGWVVAVVLRIEEGVREPHLVSRAPHGFYCTIQDTSKFGTISRLIAGGFGVLGLVFQVLSIYIFRNKAPITNISTPERRSAMKSLLIRVGVLSAYAAICVALSVIDSLTTKASVVADMLQVTVPLACGLLVITQKDYRQRLGCSSRSTQSSSSTLSGSVCIRSDQQVSEMPQSLPHFEEFSLRTKESFEEEQAKTAGYPYGERAIPSSHIQPF